MSEEIMMLSNGGGVGNGMNGDGYESMSGGWAMVSPSVMRQMVAGPGRQGGKDSKKKVGTGGNKRSPIDASELLVQVGDATGTAV